MRKNTSFCTSNWSSNRNFVEKLQLPKGLNGADRFHYNSKWKQFKGFSKNSTMTAHVLSPTARHVISKRRLQGLQKSIGSTGGQGIALRIVCSKIYLHARNAFQGLTARERKCAMSAWRRWTRERFLTIVRSTTFTSAVSIAIPRFSKGCHRWKRS
jgi:hypothetical protein